MVRSFASKQLIEAETELAFVGKHADYLSFELGEHADEMHFDGVAARDLSEQALETIKDLKAALGRAEGLVRAYSIYLRGVGA